MLKSRIVPIKYTLIVSFLILIVAGFSIISVMDHYQARQELMKSHKTMMLQSEENMRAAFKLVNIGYRVLELALDERMKRAFTPFIEAYKDSNGHPEKIDLHALQKQIGAEIDLYILNADGVVEYTSFKKDLGLDFKKWPDVFRVVEQARQESQFYGDPISVESRTGAIRKYAYWGTEDHQYVLELGLKSSQFAHLLRHLDLVRIAKQLEAFNPSLQRVRIFNRRAQLVGDQDFQVEAGVKSIVQKAYQTQLPYETLDPATNTQIRYYVIELSGMGNFRDTRRVVELVYNTKQIEDYLWEQTQSHLLFTLLIILVSLFMTIFIASWITTPIKKLVESVDIIASGQLDHRIVMETNNEMKLLKFSVITMVHNIGQHIEHISRLRNAYKTFVPNKFIQLLGKDSILDVHLGDNIEKDLSILFADIRGFTTISEQISSEATFQFLNDYFEHMEPVITQHHGFIDKYIGDGIMAIFTKSSNDALNAAIEMLKQLESLNQSSSQSIPIKIGIGIHSGAAILGTVGGPGRMEGTVIGDAVNLASRLEGMTKTFGVSCIVSGSTLFQLEQLDQYSVRLVDQVRPKGKTEPVTIYEVYDGDSGQIRQQKDDIKFDFEHGVMCYREKAFDVAKSLFEKCLARYPEDRLTALYIERCELLLTRDIPNWDMVFDLNHK